MESPDWLLRMAYPRVLQDVSRVRPQTPMTSSLVTSLPVEETNQVRLQTPANHKVEKLRDSVNEMELQMKAIKTGRQTVEWAHIER